MLDFPCITHLFFPLPLAVISPSQTFSPVEGTLGSATVWDRIAGSDTSLASASPSALNFGDGCGWFTEHL